VYELREFALKFERHFDSEIIDFQVFWSFNILFLWNYCNLLLVALAAVIIFTWEDECRVLPWFLMHYWGNDLFSVCVDIGWWLFKACIFMCWSFCLPTRQIWKTLHLANSKVYIDDLSVFMLLFHFVICFLFRALLHTANHFLDMLMLLCFLTSLSGGFYVVLKGTKVTYVRPS
jgi:hypothetical protein